MSLCLRGFVPLRLRDTPRGKGTTGKLSSQVSRIYPLYFGKKEGSSRLSLSRDLPKYMHSPAQKLPVEIPCRPSKPATVYSFSETS